MPILPFLLSDTGRDTILQILARQPVECSTRTAISVTRTQSQCAKFPEVDSLYRMQRVCHVTSYNHVRGRIITGTWRKAPGDSRASRAAIESESYRGSSKVDSNEPVIPPYVLSDRQARPRTARRLAVMLLLVSDVSTERSFLGLTRAPVKPAKHFRDHASQPELLTRDILRRFVFAKNLQSVPLAYRWL